MRTEHRRATAIFGLAILLGIAGAAADLSLAASSSKRLKPASHAGVAKVQIGSKRLVYYRATAKKPIEFGVTGPTPLRILSRYLFPDSVKTGRASYSLRVEIDGVILRTVTLKAGASGSASLAGRARIGSLKESIVQIPAGQHAIRIYPTGKGKVVALRLYPDSGKKATGKWIPFAPERFLEAVRLHEKDRETTYYRFNPTNPVELTIRGPLTLRVRTRLDFGTTNGYTQRYVAKCLLDEKPWKSFALTALASHTATYPEHPEITPGAERILTLAVPSGSHQVTILLDGTAATGASLRIQVNQRQLNKGTKTPAPTGSF